MTTNPNPKCTAGQLKTAILDSDIRSVRGILDANPDLIDYKHDGCYPHEVAMDQLELDIAMCLEDEYKCMRKHNLDPRSDATKQAAENAKWQAKKEAELDRKTAAGLMGPPADAPSYSLQFISTIEKEMARIEQIEWDRIKFLGLWEDYFYSKTCSGCAFNGIFGWADGCNLNHNLESPHFKDAMKILKQMKALLTGTKHCVYWWTFFVETKDLNIMAVADGELMHLCWAYNTLVGRHALVVPDEMLS